MNVFYEEGGAFKAGHVLSDAGTSMQVESASGKRTKVKAANVLFDFREPDAETLLRDADALATSIDLAFLWECAPDAEFSFKDLALDYFGTTPSAVESAALVKRLHGAPMYFHRKGRGHYRAAPADALKAALAGLERKEREAALQAAYVESLARGELPDAFRGAMRELVYKPDRNRVEWKALAAAAADARTTPERLMLATGGIASPYALHRDRFVVDAFPRGTGFPDVDVPALADLPASAARAFSIDDSATTEIDDAFSLHALDRADLDAGARAWRVGIHIAAPALAIARGDALDALARERYSTVYAPGEKITMLPDPVVAALSLDAGAVRPVVTLEADAIESVDGTWRIESTRSRVESIAIVDNLRHDRLDALVTTERLEAGASDFPHADEIAVLWRFAKSLHAGRQEARVAAGLRPESFHRADYAFRVIADDTVEIGERRRGAPLDLVVSELMILANATWGRFLAERGAPGIYRAQSAAFGPAGRVRMGVHPAPHVGLGVSHYAWCTSPLRRYVDLVNQRQLVACIDGDGRALPYPPKDAELFAIVSGFDAAYAAYAEHQARMERYWCLRWLEQRGLGLVDARATGREDNAVLADIPLAVRVPGLAAASVARGQRVEVDVVAVDLVDLVAQCRLAAIIEEVDELDEALDADADDVEAAGDAAAAEQPALPTVDPAPATPVAEAA